VLDGAIEPTDQERLAQATGLFHVKHGERVPPFHVKHSLYAFPDAVSPHLAAERAGTAIDIVAVSRWVETKSAPVTLVETAGGLFSPLALGLDNLSLVQALEPTHVVLVASDRLGVLHDVTAAVGLAAVRGLSVDTVVLSAPTTPDESTGYNATELVRLAIAEPRAVFPRAAPSDPRSQAVALELLAWLETKT
jgi:dethiobiotin synthetase